MTSQPAQESTGSLADANPRHTDAASVTQPGWVRHFWHAVWTIEARSAHYTLVGWAYWLALAVGLLMASVALHNTVRNAEQALLLVMAQPLRTPIYIATLLLVFYISVAAATMLARERERGTLNVLLFGPSSEGAMVTGIFLAHWRIFALALVGVLAWALVASWALQLQVDSFLLWLAVAALLLAASMIALALFTATFGKRARTSLLLFLVIAALLLLLLVSGTIVDMVTAAGGASESLLVVDRALGGVSTVLEWVSPVALFDGAATALEEGQTALVAMRLALQGMMTILLLILATWNLRRKRGEA